MALVGHPQGFALGSDAERFGELLARGDVELSVDVAQVPLDGLYRHELALRDLPVGEAVGGERRDPVLARRNRFAPREHARVAARARARRDELLVGAVGEPARAYPRAHVE